MQSIHRDMMDQLELEAKARNIAVQELIRAVIIPDWFKWIRTTTVVQLPDNKRIV